ncbi:MAG: hypothetical protein QNJ07_05185 [Woeseiaceae bacterium]|nr:hypothetical protein [Woeseiaceae bacterium]
MGLLSELRRRNVLRVAAANALVCWILIESGSVLMPTFGVPEWFFKIYVLLIAAGFVISLIVAWVFEITPEGVKLESDLDRSTYKPPTQGKGNVIIIALLVIALGVSLTFNFTGLRERSRTLPDDVQLGSIAVLPFASLSTNPENEFFTAGIHADLLTTLAENTDLRVISGTSVAEYRDTTKNAREIGDELDVDTIVEGAVRRAGEQVRISVQLVDTSKDSPIWSKTYDRELTIENVFDVQSEISMQIAASLRKTLTPEEERRIADLPTANVDAYASYVSGRNNLYQRHFATLLKARSQFEQAIALDPEYAEAYAGLGEAIMVLLVNHNAIAPDAAFSQAGAAVDTALSFDPELAEAHAVRGLIESERWEAEQTGDGNLRAATAFERAISLNPNLPSTYIWYSLLKRAEDDYEAAIRYIQQAVLVDPHNRIPWGNLPGLQASTGHADRAIDLWLEAIDNFAGWPTPINDLAEHLRKSGRLDEALAWEQLAKPMTTDPMAPAAAAVMRATLGHKGYVKSFLDDFPSDHPLYPLGAAFRYVIGGDYEAAIDSLRSSPGSDDLPAGIRNRLLAGSSVQLGRFEKAGVYLLRAHPRLTNRDGTAVTRDNVGAAVMLAYVRQLEGNERESERLLSEAESVIDKMPRLGFGGHGIRDVQILVIRGLLDAAAARMQSAIDEGFVSLSPWATWSIDEDPIIAPLRQHRDWTDMRARIDQRIAVMRKNVEEADANNDWEALRAKVKGG